MEPNLNKPHIEFTWPSETLEVILSTLEIEGLGSFNEETGFFSSWPTQENWLSYIIRSQRQIPRLLEDEVTNIEEKLSAVETTFNHHLSGLSSANDAEISKELRQLIDKLEEIEKLICERDYRAAYPYFARWFILNLAVVSLLMKYENRYAQVRGLKLWWSGKYYLDRVFHWSYRERLDQIDLQYTGAFNNRVYVRDYRENMPLTFDVLCRSEEEVELHELYLHLRCYAAWHHIHEICLPVNYQILEEVIAALSVTENSNTKQDQVLPVDSVWSEQRDLIQKEITNYQDRCGNVIEKLINPAANYLREPIALLNPDKVMLTSAQSQLKLEPTTDQEKLMSFSVQTQPQAEDPTELKKKKDAANVALGNKIKALEAPATQISQEAIQLLKGNITGEQFALTAIKNSLQAIAIFIPLPYGTGVSLVTNLFFGILQGGSQAKVDPILEHENRMKDFIRDENAKSYFDTTQQILNRRMKSLHEVNIDFLNENHKKQKNQSKIREKINELLNDCQILEERFFGTAESRNHVYTFPLIQRFLLLYKHTIYFTEAFGSPNNEALESEEVILMKKKQLYESVFNFIAKASIAMANNREKDITLRYHRQCAYHRINLYDEKSGRYLHDRTSGEYKPWEKSWEGDGKEWVELDELVLGTAKEAARVIAIEQCLRSTILQVREMYKLDAALFAKALHDVIKEEEQAKQKGLQQQEIDRLTSKREYYERHFQPASNLDFTAEYKKAVKAEYEKLGNRYNFELTWRDGIQEKRKYNLESKTISYTEYKMVSKNLSSFVEHTKNYDFNHLFLDIEREMILGWKNGNWEKKWANLENPNKVTDNVTEFHLRTEKGHVITYYSNGQDG
ncbi:MAG: hypothetical protein ACFKPT_25020 [Gloeotrichia echinulata GP01]